MHNTMHSSALLRLHSLYTHGVTHAQHLAFTCTPSASLLIHPRCHSCTTPGIHLHSFAFNPYIPTVSLTHNTMHLSAVLRFHSLYTHGVAHAQHQALTWTPSPSLLIHPRCHSCTTPGFHLHSFAFTSYTPTVSLMHNSMHSPALLLLHSLYTHGVTHAQHHAFICTPSPSLLHFHVASSPPVHHLYSFSTLFLFTITNSPIHHQTRIITCSPTLFFFTITIHHQSFITTRSPPPFFTLPIHHQSFIITRLTPRLT